jgi:hypothetical protein
MFQSWSENDFSKANVVNLQMKQLKTVLEESLKRSSWRVLFECISQSEKLIQKGYSKEALGRVIFEMIEVMLNSYWEESFFLFKSMLELVHHLISGCSANKVALFNRKSLLRRFAQKIDDMDGLEY